MFDQYLQINGRLRSIRIKAHDVIEAFQFGSEDSTGVVVRYLRDDIRSLRRGWPDGLDESLLEAVESECSKPEFRSFVEMVETVLPELEANVDEYFGNQSITDFSGGLMRVLHPAIVQSSYEHFRHGAYRDAVLDSVVAVFDLIRSRTTLDVDGDDLVGRVFSTTNPMLVFSELDTESGRSDHKGFMQILKGFYQGVRNPKAHTLEHDLNEKKATQYLVLASLLARRVEEAIDVGRAE